MKEAAHCQQMNMQWECGRATMQSLGAMLAPVTFLLPDGKNVSPMHIARWQEGIEIGSFPPILHRLRGEWPCVPFGAADTGPLPPRWKSDNTSENHADHSDLHPHGFGSNTHWKLENKTSGTIRAQLDYPDQSPISSLTRRVTGKKGQPGLDITLSVTARRDTSLPIGLHPTFALPATAGAISLHPGTYKDIWTYPGNTGGPCPLETDNHHQTLSAMRARDGSIINLSRLPLTEPCECLLLLTETDGHFELHNLDEGYKTSLEWNADHFPSVMLWISNRGRQASPWNGQHLALGVEPVCSAFDLGTDISVGTNPLSQAGIRTCQTFKKDQIWTTGYSISVEALD